MMKATKNIWAVLMAFLMLPLLGYSQNPKTDFENFVQLFPEHYLPFAIAENELATIDKSELKLIPAKDLHFLPFDKNNEQVDVYAYAAVDLEDGKKLLFHLVDSDYPFVREVYMSVYTAEGFPESTELFAAYENGVNESYTYAIVNQNKVMHRTTKTFQAQKSGVRLVTDKFRLNTIGEIVAL